MWNNWYRKLFVYIPRIVVVCGGTFYVCDVWCDWFVPDGGSEPAVRLNILVIVCFAVYDVFFYDGRGLLVLFCMVL